MLTQLNRLSVAVDGRYASDRELQFIEDYLESVEQRIEAYEKIRENEEKIAHKTKMLAHLSLGLAEDRQLQDTSEDSAEQYIKDYDRLRQTMSAKDITQICSRDLTMLLRCVSIAMLIDDLDRLRDGMLLWQETIVRSFGLKEFANITYKVIQDVVKAHLSPEEAALILPALQLSHNLLSS
jgi:Phycobilisome protein